MIYSRIALNKTKYIEIIENYYLPLEKILGMSDEEIHLDICKCVAKRRNALTFTGQSACAIFKIPRLDAFGNRPHCISEKDKGTDVIRWHLGTPEFTPVVMNGMKCVKPLDAILNMAKFDTAESLLASINHCLYEKLFSKSKLAFTIKKHSGMKGVKKLRRLLQFVSGECESPLETRAWLAIYKSGLKMPFQQVRINDGQGAFIGRVDMYWIINHRRLILEIDGDEKYRLDYKLAKKEHRREYKLRQQGYEVIHTDYEEILSGRFIEKLKEQKVPSRKDFKGTFPTN